MEATTNLRNDELLKKGCRWLIAGIVIQIAISLINKIVLAWADHKRIELEIAGQEGYDWYNHFSTIYGNVQDYFGIVAGLGCYLMSFLYLRKHGSYAIRDFSILFFVSQCVRYLRWFVLAPIVSLLDMSATNYQIVYRLFWLIGLFILFMSFAVLFRNENIRSLHKNTIIVLCIIAFVSMAGYVCQSSLSITDVKVLWSVDESTREMWRMHDALSAISNPLSSIFFYIGLLIDVLYIIFYKRLFATPSAIADDNDVPSHRFRPTKVEIGAFVAIALCFAFSMLIINKVCLTI